MNKENDFADVWEETEESTDIGELHDCPLTQQEQADNDAFWANLEIAGELENTRLYGPPVKRKQKTQRYVHRLYRRHSERVVRDMLKAIVLADEYYCEHLQEVDLDKIPLEEAVKPFETFGLQLRIRQVSLYQYFVDISRSYSRTGGGARYLFQQHDDGSIHLIGCLHHWIT